LFVVSTGTQSAWKSHQNELLRAEHDQDGEGNHPRSIASIRRANTYDPTTIPDWDGSPVIHPTSIGKLCPDETSASKIHLLCGWRAILGDEVIRGEHHIRAVSMRPKSVVKGCPVHVTATYPSSLVHDFANGPVVVPVSLSLRNQLLEAPVNFSLVTKIHPGYEILGLGRLKMSLSADTSSVVPLEVLIPMEGTHDLQSIQIQIRKQNDGEDSEETIVLYNLSQQWLVHIADSNSATSGVA